MQSINSEALRVLGNMIEQRVRKAVRELDRPKWRTKRYQGAKRYSDKSYPDTPKSSHNSR